MGQNTSISGRGILGWLFSINFISNPDIPLTVWIVNNRYFISEVLQFYKKVLEKKSRHEKLTLINIQTLLVSKKRDVVGSLIPPVSLLLVSLYLFLQKVKRFSHIFLKDFGVDLGCLYICVSEHL